jgi:hypothetical protein
MSLLHRIPNTATAAMLQLNSRWHLIADGTNADCLQSILICLGTNQECLIPFTPKSSTLGLLLVPAVSLSVALLIKTSSF